MQSEKHITSITTDTNFLTVFSEEVFPMQNRGGMLLTDRINALNFRVRESLPGYKTDWHVAGDPTLIIVQQGTLRIILRDGNSKDFSSGDMFIAKDYLSSHIKFDNTIHGHQAEVIGNTVFRAVHIKLDSM